MAAVMAMASGVNAATISEGAPSEGKDVVLDVSDFASTSTCGDGTSVIEDGCSVLLKEEAEAAPIDAGRYAPDGGTWIDSQDLANVTWTFENDTPFTSLTFALTDANDRANSFFELVVDGVVWSAGDETRANGTLDWLTVTFDEAVTEASLLFRTQHNDGWGVRSASIATVPLPASGTMLAFGIVGLAAAYRRKR